MLPSVVRLEEVFGLGADVDSPAYVNRGGLDERFKRSLSARKHIAIHGGSKQGKSWLRTRGLPDEDTILVQCTPSSTTESLLREALGRLGVRAKLKMTKSRDLEGNLDFKGAAELGKILAKASIEVSGGVAARGGSEVESEPIGRTPGDLSWVARTIAASGRRLILEDFHYVGDAVHEELAFLLKAMGEYGLFVIVVGVWPRDHLLNYYNGDLDGRVEDIHLTWSDSELREVLRKGSAALHLEFSPALTDRLVSEASGSVGLLQRLAEQLCLAEGVRESFGGRFTTKNVELSASLTVACRAVAEQMEGRFQTFADNFVKGMRRLPEGLEVYRHILEAVSDASDEQLMTGLDSAELLLTVNSYTLTEIRSSDLTQALERIDRLQARINVAPPILTYNRSSRRLTLADRAFLFFRRHGSPHWPWADDELSLTNDLAALDPLDLE